MSNDMPSPNHDADASGAHRPGPPPSPYIDPAALETSRGMPAVTGPLAPPPPARSGSTPNPPHVDPAALETSRGMPAVTGPIAPPGPSPTASAKASEARLPPISQEERQTLSRLLRRPQLHRFWHLVQEKSHGNTLSGTVVLEEPSESERLAIAGVFGLKVASGPLHLDLTTLDASLRASRFAITLEEALRLVAEENAAPPQPPPAIPGVEVMSSWRQQASGHPIVQRRPELLHWLVRLEEERLPEQLAPGREDILVRSVLDVVASLPSPGESLRPMAFRLLGDHHALDVGQPAGELVLRALAIMARRPVATQPEERRKLWHWAGVERDEVSSDVLTLGLRPTASTALCRAISVLAHQGEPMRLTLRQISRSDLRMAAGTTVFVCHHPVVVAAAADRYPAGSRPLVVAGERPGPAALALLKNLSMGGAKLRYHGDFDWHGIRVANDLYRTFPFQPWRFRAADYLEASRHQNLAPDLVGHPVYARWDDGLADAMVQEGKAIEEERLLASLLRDLAL